MTDFSYTFSRPAQDWRDALQSVASKLPDSVTPDSLHALRTLPIFGVIVVIDNETLASHQNTPHNTPDELMLAWVKEQINWELVFVKDTGRSKIDFIAHQESASLSDVSVFRYILIPKNSRSIHPDKRDAAAHIIDEQVTAYLRRKLKPKPNYNFQTNAIGQVIDFDITKMNTKRHHIDCHIVSVAQMLRAHKLACFDMDSTLIKQEVIVELAKFIGKGEEVNKITEAAMRGEIDFATSFAQRVALLKDVDASIIDEICPLLIPQPGAFAAIAALKKLGYRTALISGGFEPFAKHVANLLGIDRYYANPLLTSGGKLTGEVALPILDGKQKANIVAKLADEMFIDLEEVICIGDGANDLPMMAISDMGIAFRAKPIVQVKANASINVTGLEGVLYALGYGDLQKIS